MIEADAVCSKTGCGVEIAALDKLCWNWQTRKSPGLMGPSVDDGVASFAAREPVAVESAVGGENLGDKPPCRCVNPSVEP
jgi:hypothetical protein